jgi:hypothetical protein
VAADKFEPFTAESHDCKVINPGEKKFIIRCSNRILASEEHGAVASMISLSLGQRPV